MLFNSTLNLILQLVFSVEPIMRQSLVFLSFTIIIFLVTEGLSASIADKSSSYVPVESEDRNILMPQPGKHRRHKRLAAELAGAELISYVVRTVSFVYGFYDGVHKGNQMKQIQQKLKELDGKIDHISRDIERLQATVLYGRHVSRVRFFLSYLTNFLTPQNDTWGPAHRAQHWADSVLALGNDGVAQILHDFHDMVIGTSHLFASKPIFLIFEQQLDGSSSSYPRQVQEIVEFLYSIQASGYALWMTALNINGRQRDIASVQHVARERFTNQTNIMYRVTTAWPSGSFGLPMTDTGCPKETETGVQWKTGYRYHDNVIDNEWSFNLRFPAGSWGKDFVYQHFCMMNNTAGLRRWPNGEYCIFKKGDCPQGFSIGSIQWDDDDYYNTNRANGFLPDGEYQMPHIHGGTKIYYCCRSDGPPSTPIVLPTAKPFYLLRYRSTCQQVRNMRLSNHFFWWDDHKNSWSTIFLTGSKNDNHLYGAHPGTGPDSTNHKIFYCYYH